MPLPSSSPESAFIRSAAKYPLLTAEQEADLVARMRAGDMTAREKIINAHMRLVIAIASKYRRNKNLLFADLVSIGTIGLMKAVDRFDPSRGARVGTVAAWWILAEIKEAVMTSRSLVKIGTTSGQKRVFFGLGRALRELDIAPSDYLTDEDAQRIGEYLGVTADEVMETATRMIPVASLDAPVKAGDEEGSGSFVDFTPDPNAINPEEQLADEQQGTHRLAALEGVMSKLTERERQIVEARWLQEPPATLENLSGRFGISRERVRQIELAAIEKLQKALTGKVKVIEQMHTVRKGKTVPRKKAA